MLTVLGFGATLRCLLADTPYCCLAGLKSRKEDRIALLELLDAVTTAKSYTSFVKANDLRWCWRVLIIVTITVVHSCSDFGILEIDVAGSDSADQAPLTIRPATTALIHTSPQGLGL